MRNHLSRVGIDEIRRTIESFIPIFKKLDDEGTDYCLVGGLAVAIQMLDSGMAAFRETDDADILVPRFYTNEEFGKAYLGTYANNPDTAGNVYDALFGESGFSILAEPGYEFDNTSFVGAREDLDGISTPSFDVCRKLNGRTLDSIERETVLFEGYPIKVATVDELMRMKEETVATYHATPESTSRPQDFVDLAALREIASRQPRTAEEHGNRAGRKWRP